MSADSRVQRRGRNLGSVGLGSIIAALSGYLILFATARLLSIEMNTAFLTFWSMLFLAFGVLGGIQNESARAVRSSISLPSTEQGGRVLPSALGVGLLVVVVLLAMIPFSSHLLPQQATAGLCMVALGVVLFSAHCATNGALAGRGDWRDFARLTAIEASSRLILVVAALLLTPLLRGGEDRQLLAAEAACAVAAGAWILLATLSPGVRSALGARGDRSPSRLHRAMVVTVVGTGGSALLLVGFPLLLSITTPTGQYATAAPLILAISLTRAPLMIPLNAFQGMVITHFVDHPESGRSTVTKALGVVLGVAILGAALAWAIGPWLMTVVGGPEYALPGELLALLVLDAGLVAALTITTALLLATVSNTSYSLSWALGAIVCIAVLLIKRSVEWRTVYALMLGPAVGLAFSLWMLFRRNLRTGMNPSPSGAGETTD